MTLSAQGKLKNSARFYAQLSLVTIIFLYPIAMKAIFGINFCRLLLLLVSMIFLNMMVVCTGLKIISFFAVTNEVNDCIELLRGKDAQKSEKNKYFKDYMINQDNFEAIIDQPDIQNLISLKSIMVFIFMPTLCYQLIYPRTDRIRPFYLVKMGSLYLITQMMMFYIVGQYMMPIISFSYSEFMTSGLIFKIKMVGSL